MSRGFRKISGRVFCLLAILGLLVATAPGCGDAASDQGKAADKGPPPAVQDANKEMENFMKSQQKAKK